MYSKSTYLRIAFFVAATNIPVAVHATKKHGLLKKVWEPLCGLTDELNTKSNGVLQTADSILNAQKEFRDAADRALIFLLKNPAHPKAKPIAALRAYYSLKASRAAAAYKDTVVKKQIDAVRTATYLKGRIDEYLNLLEGARGTNNACLIDSNANSPAAARSAGKLGSHSCETQLTTLEPKAATNSFLDSSGFKGIVFGAPGDSDDTHTAATGTNKCNLLVAHATSGFIDGGQGATNAIDIMGGYLSLPITDNVPTMRSKAQLESGDSGRATAWQMAADKQKAAPTSTDSEFTNETGKLSERPTLAAVIKSVLLTNRKAAKAAIDTEMQATFGDGGAAADKDLNSLVDDEEIPSGAAGREASAKLGTIKQSDELAELVSYYELQAAIKFASLSKELDEAKQGKNTKAEENICNKIKDASECNNKPYCSYNTTETDRNKMCKFNETKAEKSGVPVTQAQTGGGATSTTSDRCTRHKDKANCEKENEGQKPGEKAKCGWIEETCKDSSFLVNRKFALSVVSAAFVALLF
uniref:VSG 800 n=2 Tax=Trypanosoma brucei TaxID=5691 RepID=Q0PZF2_TRYBB|nr:VSG 800 [Trypanosoma brucei brucei]ABG75613.1 variant surface glycoprotein MITat 1.18 [Trypanosoma brucei]CAQ57371.1 variant surface glycoprotein [Trypanosoma brucei brucei]